MKQHVRRPSRSFAPPLLACLLAVLSCEEPAPPPLDKDLAAAADLSMAPAPVPFRSRLYPSDWTPAHGDGEGRFLHDFSYAGYHRGEAALPDAPPGPVRDAVALDGADPTGVRDSTAALQKAIGATAAGGGGVVLLPAGSYRVDGLLTVTNSGVVLRGEGPARTRIFFTRGKDMSDRAHLTFAGTITSSPLVPLVAEGAARAAVVSVQDGRSLRPGDDVSIGWTITPEFVAAHGMTGVWTAFSEKWKPFFRRTVVAVDTARTPHQITLDVPLRYPALLRDGAALRKEAGYLKECGLEHLALANAVSWDDAWASLRAHAVDLIGTKDCWVRDVKSYPSPLAEAGAYHLQSGGVRVKDSARVTIADADLRKAQNRGEGGCGYLFEISTSSEVLLRDSTGADGRHNFIQNWDFGTSGCVFLRVRTEGSRAFTSKTDSIGSAAASEFHHSLAMACLIDDSEVRDTWAALNRFLWSSGAGHSATQNVFWHLRGGGRVLSYQFGMGYVIGTTDLEVLTDLANFAAMGTAPEDYREAIGDGAALDPPSLYEDQLRRRLKK